MQYAAGGTAGRPDTSSPSEAADPCQTERSESQADYSESMSESMTVTSSRHATAGYYGHEYISGGIFERFLTTLADFRHVE